MPIFENSTFHRNIEFELTDAVIKAIESRTPYRVTSRDRADTVLEGRVTRVDFDQLSKSPTTGLAEEMILNVTLDFEWRDTDVQEMLVARKSFSGSGLFTPSQPNSERMELGRFAAVQQLANDIVDEMQAAW